MLSIYTNTTSNNRVLGSEKQISIPKLPEKVPIFDFNKSREKYDDIITKFYKVNFDSISGKMYVKDYFTQDTNLDGEIGATKQVKNDCWLLAGVHALANNSNGRKYIRSAIMDRPNGDAVVYFKGVNTVITVPKIALAAAKLSPDYVKGDDDMLAIEVAVEYFKKMLITKKQALRNEGPNIINGKHYSGNVNDPLAGGFSSDMMYLLTGKCAKTSYNIKNGCSEQIKNLIKQVKDNPDKYAATCNFKKAKNGLYIHHAYAIKNVDDHFVTLTNPHNSENEEKVSIEDFYENIASITLLDLAK